MGWSNHPHFGPTIVCSWDKISWPCAVAAKISLARAMAVELVHWAPALSWGDAPYLQVVTLASSMYIDMTRIRRIRDQRHSSILSYALCLFTKNGAKTLIEFGWMLSPAEQAAESCWVIPTVLGLLLGCCMYDVVMVQCRRVWYCTVRYLAVLFSPMKASG